MGEYVPAGHFEADNAPFGQKTPETQLLQVKELADPSKNEKKPLSQSRHDKAGTWPGSV